MTTKKRVFQFKVTLEGINPAVWRQIQVPESYSFWDLHVAIQDAMGWKDYHLHLFRLINPKTGQPESIGIPDEEGIDYDQVILPGWDLAIADYFTHPTVSAMYEYDFGDDWQHVVLLEDILPRDASTKYPWCLAGAQACPPEDCGGVHGYAEFVEAYQDPSHKEHRAMHDWLGEGYDPNAFSPEAVHFDNPRKRWRIAFGDESS
jgi:hypothetical protein